MDLNEKRETEKEIDRERDRERAYEILYTEIDLQCNRSKRGCLSLAVHYVERRRHCSAGGISVGIMAGDSVN